ncbi:MAG: tetP [Bacillota bacterium]|nr:tetP [Bacillota bacterium]
MNKTIGMVAHVDAGKTTLIEQLLFNTNTIRQAGRVDNKNTTLDYHSIEKERGITVFSDQATINYNNSTIHIIDTPGHVDFSSEMERSIKILDAAIIILSAVEGIQGHTETVWKLLRKYNVPTLFFINKLDRTGADFNKVYNDIALNFTNNICMFSEPADKDSLLYVNPLFNDKSFNSNIIDFLCDHDELLLEKYLNEENLNYNELSNSLNKMISSCSLFPVFCGSALKNEGIDIILKFIDQFINTNYFQDEDFGAVVYKIKHDENNNKLTFIKITSGIIKAKHIITHNTEDEITEEKINQIKICNGSSYTLVNSLSAGELGVLIGLNNSYVGEGLGISNDITDFALKPVLKSKVIYDDTLNSREVYNIFKILNEEDPSLFVEWNDDLKQLQINVLGVIQLEVLKYTILERFSIIVDFEQPEVLYKETILNETHGFGHYEPYKHYAEVKFKISPTERNSGISFESNIKHDILLPRWQKTISKLVVPAFKKGVLTGSLVTDVHVELIKGSAHHIHTSGGDFKQATFRAIRHALENAQCILLEPYYNFKITAHKDLCGRIMADITKMSGIFDAPEIIGDNSIISGRVPVASSMNYAAELLSFSKGKGNISFIFDGYDLCHNTKEIIEKYNYDCNSDIEFTSNSIYCNKGNVYSILGNEAENYKR